jgi:hypothetical protein
MPCTVSVSLDLCAALLSALLLGELRQGIYRLQVVGIQGYSPL